jgi:molecular chaperone HtpG
MTDPATQRIPFQVDLSRIIEVLATQIYQDPLALLRENAQNAFDAIRQRLARGDVFSPHIDIRITPSVVVITDNGIGMTPTDLRDHYWRAGSSSKNTPEARAAGVVGTFGIGAMANFGIAEELVVDTESAISGDRTRSTARRDTLSTTEDTIILESLLPSGEPGTTVTVTIAPPNTIDIATAVNYITNFVAYVAMPVVVNDATVSMHDMAEAVPEVGDEIVNLEECSLSPDFRADTSLRVTRAGEVRARVRNISYRDVPTSGSLILRQSGGAIRTFRGGFGLAAVGVSSTYNLGGVADLDLLQPTAGREALRTDSIQLLQSLVAALDEMISLQLASRPEADSNTFLMEWIRRHGRYDLCGNLQARVEPEDQRVLLNVLKEKSQARPLLVYGGNDRTIITAAATDDSPLVVLAASQPRRQCEDAFINQYCQHQTLADSPTVLSEVPRSQWTTAQQAVTFRIASILAVDYFLEADVLLGALSHGLPLVVDTEKPRPRLVIDPNGATFQTICTLYDTDYTAFGSMTKDFVRNLVFPRISNLVPSSTRQGAVAFLKSIRKTRDVFEYEYDDLESLTSVWEEYAAGRLTMTEAAYRSAAYVSRNVQVVEVAATRSVRDVVPDVVENEAAIATGPVAPGAAPPILRTDISSDAKLLTIDSGDEALKGYRCFVAISDRAREERGEFFLQPHATSVVWGGQKVLFVFEHHSGEFGLYYDLQTGQVVSAESGGGPYATATIVLKDKIFIPVPDQLADAFLPKPGERKRFEVKSDLLYTDSR